MRIKTVLFALASSFLMFVPSKATAKTAEAGIASATVVIQEHRIPSAQGVMLAATLRLPKDDGLHPIVIIQSGSGANHRGGYAVLEHVLNEAGIATIEFDKRGVGQSAGTFTDTMEDMQTDLAATITWLRKQPKIDGSRIALLGHSQGAAAVPIVAERDGRIAAIVFIAGPVGERGTMFLQLMHTQLVEGGHAPELVNGVTASTRKWMESRSRGASDAVVASARSDVVASFTKAGFAANDAELATKTLDTPQLLSMYNATPGNALADLRIPVLAIFGARDEIVGDQTSAAAEALAENSNALVIEVPGANHVFGARRIDAPIRDSHEDGPWLSLLPKALIASWLRERLTVTP
jgi:uncharacterized protein